MADNIMNLFKIMLIIQLFYAFSITALAYSMPVNSQDYITGFSDLADDINLETTSEDIQSSLERQTNIPIIELGALVFYSGNIIIDLLLNFAFAVPQMLGLLVNGFLMLFNIDSYLFVMVELFASVLVMTLYFLGIIQLLTNIRSGRAI